MLETGGCDPPNEALRPLRSGGEPLVRPARGPVFVLLEADTDSGAEGPAEGVVPAPAGAAVPEVKMVAHRDLDGTWGSTWLPDRPVR